MRRNSGTELIVQAITGLFITFSVISCWRTPFLAFILLGLCLAGQLAFWREPADGAMMCFAAILGAPSEIIMVHNQVWTYHAPGLVFGVPAWLPLVWANLFCLFRRITLTVGSLIPGGSGSHIGQRLFFGFLALMIIAYFLITIFLIRKNIAFVFTVFLIPVVIFRHGEYERLLFIISAILGTLGEYMMMQLGFWHYHFPLLKSIGLPLSLPLAWGLSGVIISTLAGYWNREEIRVTGIFRTKKLF